MPLVYVHGVGNRRGTTQRTRQALRDELLRRHLLSALPGCADEHRIHSPFWGGAGGRMRWDGLSLPGSGMEALGSVDEELLDIAALQPETSPDRLVLDIALGSMPDAVDLLYTLCPDDGAQRLPIPELVSLAGLLAAYTEEQVPGAHASEAERFPWLETVRDDEDFVRSLRREVDLWSASRPTPAVAGSGLGGAQFAEKTETDQAWESLGVEGSAWSALRRGVGRLRRAGTAVATAPFLRGARRLGAGAIPLFVGDVLAYLGHRGTPGHPGPIATIAIEALEMAAAERRPDLPLVVVAHSLGGGIVHDALTYFRPDLEVDVLITVGTQVGLFEELKLFGASRDDLPGPHVERVPMPGNIHRWINVVDRNDLLSYRAAPIFDGVDDFEYVSGALWAHSAYLRQPNFHIRLARHVGSGAE